MKHIHIIRGKDSDQTEETFPLWAGDKVEITNEKEIEFEVWITENENEKRVYNRDGALLD